MSVTFAPACPVDDRPELNVANSNAAALLQLLGFTEPDGDLYGQTDPVDLLGRVLLAQALLDVATDDEHGTPAVTEGNWTGCGRRPGYLAERLAILHHIASWAAAHHVPVTWS